jgi:phage terminase small subunit
MNTKQQIFVNEYLKCWNASEAARRAGYNGDANTVGPRLLANVGIKDEIKQRVTELTMTANEALVRLAEQARGDIGNFLKFEEGVRLPLLDLKGANEKGLLHLVKKFKYNSEGQPEIELYDAQAALVHIGRVHGLFSDKVEVDIPPDSNFERALKNVYGQDD